MGCFITSISFGAHQFGIGNGSGLVKSEHVVGSISQNGGTSSISLIVSTTAFGRITDPTPTSPVNTTGANLLVVVVANYNKLPCTDAISDNKANAWTCAGSTNSTSGHAAGIWYSSNPVVGTGHTISYTGSYTVLDFMAFGGANTSSPLDQIKCNQNPNNISSLTIDTLTPSANNSVFVSNSGTLSTGVHSIDSSFVLTSQNAFPGSNYMGSGAGYLVQTTAGAVSPKWSITVQSGMGACAAIFKPQ